MKTLFSCLRARDFCSAAALASLYAIFVLVLIAGPAHAQAGQGEHTTPAPEAPSYAAQKGRLLGLVAGLTELQRQEEAAAQAKDWTAARALAERRREDAKEALRQVQGLRRSWSRDTAQAVERLEEAVGIAKADQLRFGSFDGAEIDLRIREFVNQAAEAQRSNDTILETLNTYLAQELFERKQFFEWSESLGAGGAVGHIDLGAWQEVQELVMEALQIQGYEFALSITVRNADANFRTFGRAAAGSIPQGPITGSIVKGPVGPGRDLTSIRKSILEGLDRPEKSIPERR
jgi:hypothetical protein